VNQQNRVVCRIRIRQLRHLYLFHYKKERKDASKEALTYTYTTAILIDIDQCGLRTREEG